MKLKKSLGGRIAHLEVPSSRKISIPPISDDAVFQFLVLYIMSFEESQKFEDPLLRKKSLFDTDYF